MRRILTKDGMEYVARVRASGFYQLVSNPKIVLAFYEPRDKVVSEAVEQTRRGSLVLEATSDPVGDTPAIGFTPVEEFDAKGNMNRKPMALLCPMDPLNIINYKIAFIDTGDWAIIKTSPPITRAEVA